MAAHPAGCGRARHQPATRCSEPWSRRGSDARTCRPTGVEAGRRGGPPACATCGAGPITRAWYPVFGESGLVAPTWPRRLRRPRPDPDVRSGRREELLRPFNLGRLNPLGLNLAAPALFAHGTEDQRLRYLPPIVRNEEVWCQLFSEPGAGSDLASLATRAERDGDDGSSPARRSGPPGPTEPTSAVLLARTDPDRPQARGHHLLPARPAPAGRGGPSVAPHRRRGRTSTRCSSTEPGSRRPAGRPGRRRLGGGQRHPVGRAPDGRRLRIGWGRPHRRVRCRPPHRLARRVSDEGQTRAVGTIRSAPGVVRLWGEERIRAWTNQRVRAQLRAGRPRARRARSARCTRARSTSGIQMLATDLLGAGAAAWPQTGDDVVRRRCRTR